MDDLTPIIDFKRIVEKAGIPTTEEGWKTLFKQDVDESGRLCHNRANKSPKR